MKINGKPTEWCDLQAIEMLKKIGLILEACGAGTVVLHLASYDAVLEVNSTSGEGIAGYNEMCGKIPFKGNCIWAGGIGGGQEYKTRNSSPEQLLKIALRIIKLTESDHYKNHMTIDANTGLPL